MNDLAIVGIIFITSSGILRFHAGQRDCLWRVADADASDLKDDTREFHFNIVVTLRGHYDVAKLVREGDEKRVGKSAFCAVISSHSASE